MAVIDHFYYTSDYRSSCLLMVPRLCSESSTYSVNKVFDTKMCNKELLPVCCYHLGNTLYVTGPISDSRNPWRNNMSATPGTTSKHHFCSTAATVENGWKRLTLTQIVVMRRENMSVCLIRHRNKSGKVGPVVFDGLPTG